MESSDGSREFTESPAGFSGVDCRGWGAAAYALSQPGKYQGGSAGRAEPRAAGDPECHRSVVAMARASTSVRESRAICNGGGVAGLLPADRRAAFKLSRNVIGRCPDTSNCGFTSLLVYRKHASRRTFTDRIA